MTELPIGGELLTASGLLAATAAVLLMFVSVGVVYLSAVEWRDRRRRKAAEKAGSGSSRSGSGASRRSASRSSASRSSEPRSPTAFGRRP
ncbi:hypothetical protein [Cyanobium sp. CH-040]|uniref:hypothetical protein n=1 Tax=Cyanobium sp. CH-040 TaxID=2823708 RepID=UPI0020CDC216|nr:hypothetical protein [Cyanobium sp. CH-040]MCP9928744.1 hypothetical protein [Cyanobium sp. CH-040]